MKSQTARRKRNLLCDLLCRRGQNQINLAYSPSRPNARLY